MEAINTYALPNDRVLKIYHDDSPETPREWDNLSKLIFFGNYCHLGDNHKVDNSDCNSWEDVEEEILKHFGRKNVALIQRVYAYVHSGMTISLEPFSCRWDSGVLGFQVVLKSDIRENWGIKRVTEEYVERAHKVAKGEIETLDTYVRGEIYGFQVLKVETCDKGCEHEEHEDSCWGFYGDDIKENGILDHLSEEDEKAVLELLEK